MTVEEAREQAVPSVRTYTRPKNLELAATDIAKANFDDPTVEPKGTTTHTFINMNDMYVRGEGRGVGGGRRRVWDDAGPRVWMPHAPPSLLHVYDCPPHSHHCPSLSTQW